MKTLKHIWRGCGYLPDYGDHPGTPVLFLLIVLGVLVGASNGFYGAVMGAGVMALIFGPVYLIGAYQRSKDSKD